MHRLEIVGSRTTGDLMLGPKLYLKCQVLDQLRIRYGENRD